MMNHKVRPITVAGLLAVSLLALIMVSCMNPMKGYKGLDLPSDKTSSIEGAAFTNIVSCDGERLSANENDVITLPGEHTLEVFYTGEQFGELQFYSNHPVMITISTLAGHRYEVYAHLISRHYWAVLVTDKKTGQRVLRSPDFPVSVEYIRASN